MSASIEVLGHCPLSECFILSFQSMHILLDCGLEVERMCQSLGDGGDDIQVQTARLDSFDMALIDIILISNHLTIMGLPYITEYSNFKGKIYATLPTLTIGQCELLESICSI